MKRILAYIIPVLAFYSCENADLCDCFKSTGDETEEIRVTDTFSHIELRDNVDLYLDQDSNFSVKVVAGKNIIDGIITECSDGKLSIRNENSCNWVRNMEDPIKVYVSLPLLAHLSYSSYGNVYSVDTLRMHEIKIDVFDGSGSINLVLNNTCTRLDAHQGVVDINLSGKSGVCYFYSNATGPVKAADLSSDITFISSYATGDSYIWVRDILDATIEYKGDIYYRGEPDSIRKVINGSGQLIPY